MKTILFSYDSPVGKFWLHPEPDGRVQLRLDGARLKTYSSAKAAARDVSQRTTGWTPWDTLENARAPKSLAQWKRAAATKRGGPKAPAQKTGDGEPEMEAI